MDPNTTLAELRQAFRAYDLATRADDAGRFGKLFTALDEWLSKGGALPAEWDRCWSVLECERRNIMRDRAR